jgi:hypothetical protein
MPLFDGPPLDLRPSPASSGGGGREEIRGGAESFYSTLRHSLGLYVLIDVILDQS